MAFVLSLSITIRLVALGLSVVLLRRARDWRMGFLSLVLVLMALRQSLSLVAHFDQSSAAGPGDVGAELPALAVSVLALLAVIFLGRMLAEQRQARDSLHKSGQLLRNILDSLFSFVGVMTPTGILTQANQAALKAASLKPEDTLGKPFEEAYWWSYSPAMQAKLRAAIRSAARGEPVRFDARLRLGEERFLIMDFALTPLFDSAGQVSHLIPSAIDITGRKRTERALRQREEQLRQSQKVKAIGTLAGGIAHDFNNMLSVVVGHTQLAIAHVPAQNPAHRNLREVLTAADRAEALVRQILAFSRQDEPERRLVSLRAVLDEVLRLTRATLPSTIQVHKRLDAEPDLVLADPIQIHQVVVNLCTNAAHAMRNHGGLIEVSLESLQAGAQELPEDLEPGPYLRLTVQDTGCGIAPEIVDKIFDPFFTTKQDEGGTGMGLSVVHGIVAGHGGTVTIDSEPGRGATFRIYLPQASGEIVQESESEAPVPRGSERLLVVEDEPALARTIEQMLVSLGYRVVVAIDGLDGLERFRVDPESFDLVITDQTMPGLMGDRLAVELLRIRPELPIILCTGFSERMTREQALALGIRGYMTKPIRIGGLAGAVRSSLDETIVQER